MEEAARDVPDLLSTGTDLTRGDDDLVDGKLESSLDAAVQMFSEVICKTAKLVDSVCVSTSVVARGFLLKV
jgi:hypothetical protein